MTPYEATHLYLALKLHFTDEKYDFFKYNGKIKASPQGLESRKDICLIRKLAKHSDPKGYLIANFLDDRKSLFDMTEDLYIEWLAKQQSLMYRFKQDLAQFDNDYLAIMMCYDGSQHPLLLESYLYGHTNLETLIIIDRCNITPTSPNQYNFTPAWDKAMANDPVWKKLSFTIKKYGPFVQFNSQQVQQIMNDKFQPVD